MIYISNLLNEGLGKHLKKHWGKYALLGGGLVTAAIGKEIEGSGVSRAMKNAGEDSSRPLRIGKAMQKYGHASAGAGVALGVKKELDDEARIDKKKKR